MSNRGLTRADYRQIQTRAWEYLRRGGGVLPHYGDPADQRADYDHLITQILDEHFGGPDVRAAFARACAGLAPHTAAMIDDTVLDLLTAHRDAAFSFGLAVGRQINPPQTAPAPTTRPGDQATHPLLFEGRRTRDDPTPPDDPQDRGEDRRVRRQPVLH